MDITTAGVVMFVHVAAVILSFMVVAVLLAELVMTRRARTVAQCRPWVPVSATLERLMPVGMLLMVGSGAWLIHLSGDESAWGDGWIVVSLVLVAAVAVAGAARIRRSKGWAAKISGAPDGAVPDEVRAAGVDPLLWYVEFGATGAFLGVVFLMSAEPSAGASVVIGVVAVVLGLAAAVPFLRRPVVISLPEQAARVGASTTSRTDIERL